MSHSMKAKEVNMFEHYKGTPIPACSTATALLFAVVTYPPDRGHLHRSCLLFQGDEDTALVLCIAQQLYFFFCSLLCLRSVEYVVTESNTTHHNGTDLLPKKNP